MEQIEERIEYIKMAIKTLTAWQPKTHVNNVNKIINLAEYKEELEKLEQIKRENASLFV